MLSCLTSTSCIHWYGQINASMMASNGRLLVLFKYLECPHGHFTMGIAQYLSIVGISSFYLRLLTASSTWNFSLLTSTKKRIWILYGDIFKSRKGICFTNLPLCHMLGLTLHSSIPWYDLNEMFFKTDHMKVGQQISDDRWPFSTIKAK